MTTALFHMILGLEDQTSSDDTGLFLCGTLPFEDLAKLRFACAFAALPAERLAEAAELIGNGYTIAAREPKLNTDHMGVFMIAEALEEWDGTPTENGANGPWCLIGDDLAAMVKEAHDFGAGMVFDSYLPEA